MRKVLFLLALAACSPSGPRDVAGENKDVRVGPGDAGASAEAYVYVARRAHGIVALAEARHMKDDEAREIVDRLASDLDACAAKLESEGHLVDGAARVIAVSQPSGPPALNVRLAPGGDVAQNALMCLVAPVRSIAFPKGTGSGSPAIAIEATWGPTSSSAADGGP